MKDFHTYINEVLYKPVIVKTLYNDEEGSEYKFTINNLDYRCVFEQLEYLDYANAFEVYFITEEYGLALIDSGGKSLTIFSTVFNLIKQFLLEHQDVDALVYKALEVNSSRVKLYDKFSKSFPIKTNMKLVNSFIKSGDKWYVFERV